MSVVRFVLCAVVSFLLCLPGAAVRKDSCVWDVGDVRLCRSGDDSVRVDLAVRVISSGGGRMFHVLRPRVSVSGRWYRMPELELSSCSGDSVLVSVFPGGVEPVEVWVDDVVRRRRGRECSDVSSEERRVAAFRPVPCPVFLPEYPLEYVDGGGVCERVLSMGFAPVFAPGSRVFDASLEDNDTLLAAFEGSVRSVMMSRRTKVMSVELYSYVDPAGPERMNLNRSQARLSGVWARLKRDGVFGRRSGSVRLMNVGEDWEGFAGWFRGTAWTGNAALADVVLDAGRSPDLREEGMREFGPFWDYVSAEVFPGLNRFECRIRFSLVPYADDSERMMAFLADPRLLSPGDYSCLLKAERQWSPLWFRLVFAFASEYPLCREAQVDACAAEMYSGCLNEASGRFRYLPDEPFVRYYRAMWMVMMGMYGEALGMSDGLQDDVLFARTVGQLRDVCSWYLSPSPWVASVMPRYASDDVSPME